MHEVKYFKKEHENLFLNKNLTTFAVDLKKLNCSLT